MGVECSSCSARNFMHPRSNKHDDAGSRYVCAPIFNIEIGETFWSATIGLQLLRNGAHGDSGLNRDRGLLGGEFEGGDFGDEAVEAGIGLAEAVAGDAADVTRLGRLALFQQSLSVLVSHAGVARH